MTWFRKNPLLASALTVCALLVLGEGWCIYERHGAARAAAKKLTQRRAELQAMGEIAPPPTRDVATAIETDLARARRALAAMQAELKGRGPAAERMHAAKVPAARTDAYFDLATFVEKTKELAKKHDVDVRPEAARFGFALHANEAPEIERIEAVFHQRQVAQYLVEALLEARPRALVAVKREPPLTKKEREDREAAALAAAAGTPPPEGATEASAPQGDGPDFFTLDPRGSVRAAGVLDTSAFRLVFIGETGSLRAFLNRLAGFELPVLVREVEVEPVSADEAMAVTTTEEAPAAEPAAPVAASMVLTVGATPPAGAKAAPRPSTAAPIVPKPFSKFTVTVEYIELVPGPGNADGTAPAAKAEGS